ncbi:MAG: ABC transporter substrate-binding protein [Chloroflexi bacterium]|nr:ABC transporter substrate-binding protein [Chloroflexota bacterium]
MQPQSGRFSRRALLRAAALLAGGTSLGVLAACQPAPAPSPVSPGAQPTRAPAAAPTTAQAPTTVPAAPKQRTTMTVGSDVDTEGLDPHLSQGAGGDFHMNFLWRRLAEYTPAQEAQNAGFAESWEMKDPTTYVFKLRQGVKYHSGREATAEDAEFSWKRAQELGPKGRFAGYMVTLDSFKATGKYEFTAKLKRPDALFLANSCTPSASLVDKETVADIAKKPIGFGPYKFIEWLPGEQQVYEKFEDYYDKGRLAGYPDRVVVKVIKEEQARIAALKAGQVDLITRVSPAFTADIEKTANLQLIKQPFSASYQCVAFNLRKPPFDNFKLRQALAHAVNREVIQKNVWFGTGDAGCSLLPSTHWAYTPQECPKFDLALAKKLVQESGAKVPMTVDFAYWNFPEQTKMGEILKNDWKDLGINLELRPVETAVYIEDIWRGKKTDMTIAWYTREPDPDGLFSSVLRKEQGNNFMGYFKQEIEELFDQGRSETDKAKRIAIYDKIMKVAVLGDIPLIKMQSIEIQYASSKKVQMALHPQGYPNWIGLKVQ